MEFKHVIIEEVNTDTGFVFCVDQLGSHVQFPLHVTPAKGALPVVGESWIVDQRHGKWTLATCVSPKPIVVTGARSLAGLYTLLADLGLIIDETTP